MSEPTHWNSDYVKADRAKCKLDGRHKCPSQENSDFWPASPVWQPDRSIHWIQVPGNLSPYVGAEFILLGLWPERVLLDLATVRKHWQSKGWLLKCRQICGRLGFHDVPNQA